MKTRGGKEDERPRINLRPLLFCALGLAYGLLLYYRLRFGGFSLSDFCFLLLFLALSFVPFRFKRVAAILLAIAVFGGAGAGLAHLSVQRYLSGIPEGDYTFSGTVVSFGPRGAYTEVILDDIAFDGHGQQGKMYAIVPGTEVRPGDILLCEGEVEKCGVPRLDDSYAVYLYYSDIRYDAGSVSYTKTGTSKNPLLRLNTLLYERLHAHMDSAEASVAYTLLTGNPRTLDDTLEREIRTAGIAHIFAVSGMHIGILFGAVYALFGWLGKRKAFWPAFAAALLYTAFCNFTVSSVRALVMCAALGSTHRFGRKYDLLQSASFAALAILLFSPAQWLSAGFRLSFGAVYGIALFAGPLRDVLIRWHLPKGLSEFLGGSLSVVFFTAPILFQCFGCFPVWGMLLNLIFIPLLPPFFLTLIVSAAIAVIIPPAAAVLAFPGSLLSLMLTVFSYGDFSYVITGFSLGMGGSVFFIGAILLSDRVRLKPMLRALAAGACAVVFAVVLTLENVVFSGVKGEVIVRGDVRAAVLLRTPSVNVLIVGEETRSADIRDILDRRCGSTDALFVLSDEELPVINAAFSYPVGTIYARDEIATGLQDYPVAFGEEQEVGGIRFTFVTRSKLFVEYEGASLEIDFTGRETLGTQLFIGGSRSLQFHMERGIIKT